ncbi:YjdJ family protein [Aciduricibacillus chroicocephali]|uniref:YjdJ family protein n=1 Tax=Aciduricibacillus chroicocephali TaxID=3054939 RepID=A0ABY9KWV9_9BACI|nr:YjdJ family protein [Bacillaceae bacterium 44XB]
MFLFIQLGVTIFIFLASFLFSWYEGSAVLENPWEWNYSTPFSHLLHGEVNKVSDISLLDHFVYAAKFHPLYPALMLLSGVYLLVLVGRIYFRKGDRGFFVYVAVLGALLLLLSLVMFNAYTSGGKLFFYLSLASGIICFVISTFTHYHNNKSVSSV